MVQPSTIMMPSTSSPAVVPRASAPLHRRPVVAPRATGGMSYKDAGVDIDAGNELVRRIQKLNPSIGGFSGMVPFGERRRLALRTGREKKLMGSSTSPLFAAFSSCAPGSNIDGSLRSRRCPRRARIVEWGSITRRNCLAKGDHLPRACFFSFFGAPPRSSTLFSNDQDKKIRPPPPSPQTHPNRQATPSSSREPTAWAPSSASRWTRESTTRLGSTSSRCRSTTSSPRGPRPFSSWITTPRGSSTWTLPRAL